MTDPVRTIVDSDHLRPAPDPSATFRGTAWRRSAQMSAGDGIVSNAWPLVGLAELAQYRAAIEDAARC